MCRWECSWFLCFLWFLWFLETPMRLPCLVALVALVVPVSLVTLELVSPQVTWLLLLLVAVETSLVLKSRLRWLRRWHQRLERL